MSNNEFPEIIQQHIQGFTCVKDTMGCSEASVYCFTKGDKVLYLKKARVNSEFENEKKILQWLQDKLPVPEIIVQCTEKDYGYLLMTKAIGEMACSKEYLNNPKELVRLLAEGIKALKKVDISNCPVDYRLKKKLGDAWESIKNNEVDMSDWEESTPFKSPKELYDYLVENQPEEELVFSHGDYCLPNVFFHNEQVSGFIDLGRAGIGDIWQDIALGVRSLEHNFQSKEYTNLFFEYLNIKPNYEKINYYILLDELF